LDEFPQKNNIHMYICTLINLSSTDKNIWLSGILKQYGHNIKIKLDQIRFCKF
jgi:hypothetical protein